MRQDDQDERDGSVGGLQRDSDVPVLRHPFDGEVPREQHRQDGYLLLAWDWNRPARRRRREVAVRSAAPGLGP